MQTQTASSGPQKKEPPPTSHGEQLRRRKYRLQAFVYDSEILLASSCRTLPSAEETWIEADSTDEALGEARQMARRLWREHPRSFVEVMVFEEGGTFVGSKGAPEMACGVS